LTINDTDSLQNVSSPLEQARSYLNKLQNLLKKHRILTNLSGINQGKLSFPIGTGAVMSNITIQEAEENGLLPFLNREKVIFKDEIKNFKKGVNPEIIVERLQSMFTVKFRFSPLTQDQVNTIRGEIYPEIVIREDKATSTSVPADVEFELLPTDTILKTLDARQESLAKRIGDGHRIFFGVSGSGKTLLLISRAKYLINRYPHHKILILCFNICLASSLRSILYSDNNNPQYQKIDVMHFHDWAKYVLGSWPNDLYGNQDECLGQKVLERLNSYGDNQKWDVILIDEAHTFPAIWFKCCVNAIKDKENGDLMIVADGNQKLYKLPDFRWKDVGVKAQGRTVSKKFDLDKNYRNTQEILSSALAILDRANGSMELLDEEEITFPLVQPQKSSRNGDKPKLYATNGNDQQDKMIVSIIIELVKSGISSHDIAILHRQVIDKFRLQNLFNDLRKNEIESEWVTKDKKSKIRFNTNTGGVKFIASLSSLGLEFEVVLFIWLEQFDNCINSRNGEVLALREIYVGMTRAKQSLHLFANQNSKLYSLLSNDSNFEVIQVN
jgi:superfamily I DNA and RNA helicase